MDAAFMEFVKNHNGGIFQRGIVLKHTGQNRFRQHLNPGLCGNNRLVTGTITNRHTGLFPQQMCHTAGSSTGGKYTRLQHENFFGTGKTGLQ